MSQGMKSLRVNSGEMSVFYRAGITGLATINTFIDLWELPTGTVIYDATIWVTTADTTATVDVALVSKEAAPRTFASITDAIAADIGLMTQTVALLAPLTGTQAQRKLALTNTSAGTGDGVYAAIIVATRPGPEPQASA